MLLKTAWTTLLTLLLEGICIASNRSDCIQKVFKNCSCHAFAKSRAIRVYNCSSRGFLEIPSFQYGQKPEEILLDSNRIRNFPNFTAFPDSLKILNLSNNELWSFSRNVFNGLSKLTVLDLSNNFLFSEASHLPSRAFKDLKNLKLLNLQRNVRKETKSYINHTAVFAELRNLEVLKSDAYLAPIFSSKFRYLTKITRVEFSGTNGFCELNSLNASGFVNLPYIEVLVLNNCQMKNIQNGTFRDLKFLKVLDISFNEELTFDVFPVIFSDFRSTNVTTLIAKKLHCTFGVGTKIFKYQLQHFKQTKIKKLYLDDNKIEVFGYGFSSMFNENLLFLSMRKNRLILDKYLFEVSLFENLQEVDGSLQHYQYNPFVTSDLFSCDDTKRTSFYSRIFTNEATGLKLPPPQFEYYIPRKLKKAIFSRSGMSFKHIGMIKVNKNNSLEYLDVSGNRASNIEGPVYGFEKLTHLNMSFLQCSTLGSHFFMDLKQLEVLDLQGNNLGNSLQNERTGALFSFLPNLQILNLSTNGINDLNKRIFSGLTGLKILILRKNSINVFRPRLRDNKNLVIVDLSENSMTELSSFFMADIDYLFEKRNVSLSFNSNPFRCTCSNLKMWRWFVKNQRSITDFQNLSCFSPEGTNYLNNMTSLSEMIEMLEKKCNSYLGVIFVSLSLIILIITILGVVIVYRYRWKIRYFFYIFRNKYKQYQRLTVENNLSRFRYDAFVSYSDENKEFVLDEMVRELEEVSQLRLCLSGRDFRPGVSIAENITRAINKSKKTIVIMSVDYLLSYWCMYELNMARMESLYSRSDQDVLMMIVLEKVAFQNAPHVVLELINNNSFLEYPDDQHGKVLFWEKIRETLT